MLLAAACAAPVPDPDPDLNGDGSVDILDATLASSCVGQTLAEVCACRVADVDLDGDVDLGDVGYVVSSFGQGGFPIDPPDTVPPVLGFQIPDPSRPLAASRARVVGSVDDPLAYVRVNGTRAAILGSGPAIYFTDVDLAVGQNPIEVQAEDRACNAASLVVTLVRVEPDPDLTGDGTVDDADVARVASCVGVDPDASCGCRTADVDGDRDVDAEDVAAVEGALGGSGYPVEPVDTTPPVVAITSPAASAVLAASPVEVTGTLDDATSVVSVNGVPAAVTPGTPALFSAQVPLAEGQNVLTALATDAACNEGSASVAVALASGGPAGPGVIAGEVYDDTTGRPLSGAIALLESLDGEVPVEPESVGTDARGRYRLACAPGLARVRISKPGHGEVFRDVRVAAATRSSPRDARLAARAAAQPVSSVLGGTLASGAAELEVPPGALASDLSLALTPLSGQALVAPLPLGWSSLSALEIAPEDAAFAPAAAARLAAPAGLPAATRVRVARFDRQAHAWLSLGEATRAADALAFAVAQGGQHALVVADAPPQGPPEPAPGAPLPALAPPATPPALEAVLRPSPRILFAEPGARAEVGAEVTASGFTPSGSLLEVELAEVYEFGDSTRLAPEPMAQDLTLSRVGGAEPGLAAGFPAGPGESFDPTTLRLGTIDLAARRADAVGAPGGAVVGPAGGRIEAPDGARVAIAAGAASEPLPVALAALAPEALPLALPDSLSVLAALSLDLHGGHLSEPAELGIPRPPGLAPDAQVLVLRLSELAGATRFEVVAQAESVSAELLARPGALGLRGVREGGRYLFAAAAAPQGFVAGTVSGPGSPFAGAVVSGDSLPVVALTDAVGRYAIPALVGAIRVTALDSVTGDEAEGDAAIAAAGEVASLALSLATTPPRVVAADPPDGATGVSRLPSISVLFSEPVRLATGGLLADALVLRSGGSRVAGSVSLSPDRLRLSLVPSERLASDALHELALDPTLEDESGHPLGAAFNARFTTVDETRPAPPPPGQIQATIPGTGPGATSLVTAGAGTAEPGGLAIIANLTTGALTTLVPDADGSFAGSVQAARADRLELRLRDAAGNEVTVALGPFRDPDGRVVVGSDGGVVEGPGGVQVEIPAGALPAGTAVQVLPLAPAELPIAAPDDFPFAGGVKLDLGGATPSAPLDLAIRAPSDASADDQVIVARSIELPGRSAWTVVDRAHLDADGRYRTASPPFPGALGSGSFAFLVSGLECVSYSNITLDYVVDFVVEAGGVAFSFLTGNVSSVTLPASCDRPLAVQVRDPDTNAVIDEIDARTPAQRDEIAFEPGVLTDDHTPPVVLETRTFNGYRVTRIEVRFSEPMDAETVATQFRVEDQHHVAVTGTVELFEGGRLAVFEPDLPFRLGEQHLVDLTGSTDRAGNALALGEPIAFTPFDPQERDPDPFGQDPALAALLAKRNQSGALSYSTRDVASLGEIVYLANGLASEREQYDPPVGPQRLIAVDVRNPFAPLFAGSTGTQTNPRVLAAVEDANVTTSTGDLFRGDLLLLAGGGRVPAGELATRFEIYDVRACSDHGDDEDFPNCLAHELNPLHGYKLLSTPTGVAPSAGAPAESGVPQQMAVLHQRGEQAGDDTLVAYVVVSGVGLAAVDVAKAFDQPATDTQRGPDGLVRSVRRNDAGELRLETDFLDVAVLKDLVVSVALEAATGEFSLELFSAQLTNRRGVFLPGPAARVGVLENFLVDVDQDGRVGTAEEDDDDPPDRPLAARDELFDLALVGSGPLYQGCGASSPCGELYVVDLSAHTDLAHAEDRGVIARIPLPGPAFSVEVDREALVAYVEVRGHGLVIVDLASLRAPIQQGVAAEGLVDENGDATDDRALALIPKPDIFAGELAIDHTRGLAYVNGAAAGADVVRVANRCNELSSDLRPEEPAPISPDEERRRKQDDEEALRREKEALQAVLAGAAATLFDHGIAQVALLEQGSGACFWRDDFPRSCTSFQPGASDHDIEVLVPQAQVAAAQGLLDTYLDQQNDSGATQGVARLTLYAFSRESLLDAEMLNGTPRNRSGDADGDLALGRQTLLLLWILEGEYVDGYPLRDDQENEVSLADTLAKLKAKPDEDPVVPAEPSALPRLEGYEWSRLQEFNLYKTGAMLRIAGGCGDANLAPQWEVVSGADFVPNAPASHFDDSDFLSEDCQEQLHTVAKAAIRTAMARLVADELANPLILEDLERAGYRGPEGCQTGVGDTRNPPSSPRGYTRKRCESFEEFIASLAVKSVAAGVGPFQATDLPSIFRFYCIKVGPFCKNRAGENFPILASDEDANAFIDEALAFIETAQQETRPIYDATADAKPIGDIPFLAEIAVECGKHGVAGITADSPRSALRACNLAIVGHKLDGDPGFTDYVAPPENVEYVPDGQRRKNLAKKLGLRRIVQKTLRARVSNNGVFEQAALPFALYEGDGVRRDGYTPKHTHLVEDLLPGERRVLETDADEEPLFPLVFDLEQHAPNVPGALAFFLDPERSVPEVDKQDNLAAFFYYRLDRASPEGPPVDTSPESPVSTDPHPICGEAPRFEVTVTARTVEDPEGSGGKDLVVQVGQEVRLDFRVRNRRNDALASLVVRRAGRSDPVYSASSLPGASAAPEGLAFEETFTPDDVGTFTVDVMASARDEHGNQVEAPADRVRVRVLEPPCDAAIVAPHPDPNPLDEDGLPVSTVMQGGRVLRYYRVLDGATNEPIPNAVVEGLRRELPGGALQPFSVETNEEGWIVHEPDPAFRADEPEGIAFFADELGPPGSRHAVEMRTVQGEASTCPVTFEVAVKEREFERQIAAGDAINAGGNLRFFIAGLGKGAGFSVSEAGTLSGPTSLSVGQTVVDSVKLGLGLKDRGFDVRGVRFKGDASASIGAQISHQRGYTYTLPLDNQSCFEITAKLGETMASVAVAPFTVFSPMLNKPFFDLADSVTGAGQRLTLLGDAAAVAVTAGVSGGPENALAFNSDYRIEALRNQGIAFKAGAALDYLAKVGVTTTRTFEELSAGEERFPHLEPSLSFRVGADFTAGIEAGATQEKLRLEGEGKDRVAVNVVEMKDGFKARFGNSFGVSGLLQYAASVDATSFPPEVTALSIKRSVPKLWGWSGGLDPIGNINVPGATRSNVFEITEPERFLEAAERIALLGGAGMFLNVPAGGGAPTFELQGAGEQYARIFALADTYTESIEHGIGVERSLKLKELTNRSKVDSAKLDLTLKLDSSVSYDTLRAAVRAGRLYPLELYREDDPLLPTPLDAALPDRLLGCFDLSTAQVTNALHTLERTVTKGIGAVPTLLSMVLSPSGVDLTIDGAAEPDPATPLEVSLVGFPYQALPPDEVPLLRDPSDVAGDASRPHYGVGGFFQFDPEGYALAAPARLVMHYDEALIAGLDEQSFRIYAWSPERGDWDFVGGTLDAAANTVTADVEELRLFTIAPRMPAGTIALTASVEPGAPAPNPTTRATYTASGLARNDGTPVPDGTLYSVIVAAPLDTDLMPVGTIETADADPSTPGVQIASQDGSISFAAELPGTAGAVKVIAFSVEGTAFGEPVIPYAQE